MVTSDANVVVRVTPPQKKKKKRINWHKGSPGKTMDKAARKCTTGVLKIDVGATQSDQETPPLDLW